MPPLKPQDIAVALQLLLTPAATYAALSAATRLSQGEVHNAVRRLRGARLVLADAQQVHCAALLEFLGSGVAYACPAEAGAESRGVPTAHSAGELSAEFGVSDPLVWPKMAGSVRGASAHAREATAARTDHVHIVRVTGGVTIMALSPNRDRLVRTARLLRPLLGKFVFVGGQVAELLVTDPLVVRIRPADDVDVVVPVTTRRGYYDRQMRRRLPAGWDLRVVARA